MPPASDLLLLMVLLSFAALMIARYIVGAWPFDTPDAHAVFAALPATFGGMVSDRSMFGPDEGIYPLACSQHDPADTGHHRRSDSGLPSTHGEDDPEMDRPYIPGIHAAPAPDGLAPHAPYNHLLDPEHGGLQASTALHDGPAHSHDYRVSVTLPGDGMCRSERVKEWTVPCGVCEAGSSDVFPALTAKFGADVHADIREQIRLHLERATRLLYPESTSVTVR